MKSPVQTAVTAVIDLRGTAVLLVLLLTYTSGIAGWETALYVGTGMIM